MSDVPDRTRIVSGVDHVLAEIAASTLGLDCRWFLRDLVHHVAALGEVTRRLEIDQDEFRRTALVTLCSDLVTTFERNVADLAK